MFSNIKTKFAVAAVVAAGAVALPAAAQADNWTSGGSVLVTNKNVSLAGAIEMNAAGGALRVNCEVSGTATLLASGATGTINTFVIDASSCTTNLPGCAVSAASTSAPWGVVGSAAGSTISISSVSFTNTLAGAGCGSLAGTKTATANSALVASLGSSIASLSPSSGGLTVTPGGLPASLTGDIELSDDIAVV